MAEPELQDFQVKLNSTKGIKAIKFEPKERALEKLQSELGVELTDQENPLSDSFYLYVSKNANVEELKNTIKLSANDNEQDITYESFDNNKLRVQFFTTWIREREHWANEQQQKDIIRRFFIDLYQLHIDLNRDSEAIELMVGNGILMDKQKENVNHPILLKKVKIRSFC